MAATREDLPENIDALKAVLLVERARAVRVEAELAVAKAKASDDDALIVMNGTACPPQRAAKARSSWRQGSISPAFAG